MYIRISQATGGTKYGRITAVTSTTLTVYFGSAYTLTNETISGPVYSSGYTPLGVPATVKQNMISADQLATNAISLGKAAATSTFTTSSGTEVQVTGLSVTVTIPAGGRDVKVSAFINRLLNQTANNGAQFSLWNGTVGVGSIIQSADYDGGGIANAGSSQSPFVVLTAPAAGSVTYNASLKRFTGSTAQINASATAPNQIIAEVV